jgi:hypothetical protein
MVPTIARSPKSVQELLKPNASIRNVEMSIMKWDFLGMTEDVGFATEKKSPLDGSSGRFSLSIASRKS